MTVVPIGLFAVWVFLPSFSDIGSFYERYLSAHELEPRVFAEGIFLKFDREAPPVAALEEALREEPWTVVEDESALALQAKNIRTISLVVGGENTAKAFEQFAEKIIRDNRRIPYFFKPKDILPQPIRLAKPSGIREEASDRGYTMQASNVQQRHFGKARVETLRSHLTVQSETAAKPARVISLSQQGLTKDQLLAALFVPFSGATRAAVSAQHNRNIFSPTVKAAGASQYYIGKKAEREIASQSMDSYSAHKGIEALGLSRAPNRHQVMVSGHLEFNNGLALTNPRDELVVFREKYGRSIESGVVSVKEGRYQIFIESLDGDLIAELRSAQGEVLGRGSVQLAMVTQANSRGSLAGVNLIISPVNTGIYGRVQSAYRSHATGTMSGKGAKSYGLSGAKVSFLQTPIETTSVAAGLFEELKFIEGSRVSAEIKIKDHRPTLAVLSTGNEASLPVFSNTMIDALISLTLPIDTSPQELEVIRKERGLVWGRVTRAGQPVEGAEVEVLTEGSSDPFYFNTLMLPDKSLRKTGKNGLFAIPAVTAGIHGVQVHLKSKLSDPVYYQIKPGDVTSLDLDVMKASEIHPRIYDAFRPDIEIPAEVIMYGHIRSRRMVIPQNQSEKFKVRFAHLGMPVVMDVLGASDDLPIRYIQNPETRYLDVPMVKRTWFESIKAELKYNAPMATGSAIGYIDGVRFKVALSEDAMTSESRLVYFDSRGEITTSEFGEPGGGFILLGIKDGIQTLLIQPEGSDRVYAATVLIQGGIPSVINHSLQ